MHAINKQTRFEKNIESLMLELYHIILSQAASARRPRILNLLSYAESLITFVLVVVLENKTSYSQASQSYFPDTLIL